MRSIWVESTFRCITTPQAIENYESYSVKFEGTTVTPVTVAKYLGVLFGPQLNWTMQIARATAATMASWRALAMVWHAKTGVNLNLLRQMYLSIVCSRSDYACTVWYNPEKAKTQLANFIKVHKAIVRTMPDLPKNAWAPGMLADTDLLSATVRLEKKGIDTFNRLLRRDPTISPLPQILEPQASSAQIGKKVLMKSVTARWSPLKDVKVPLGCRIQWNGPSGSFRKKLSPQYPSKRERKFYFSLSRSVLRILMALRYRRAKLLADQFASGRSTSSLCTNCIREESVAHFLLWCSKFTEERARHIVPLLAECNLSRRQPAHVVLHHLLFTEKGIQRF